MINVVKELGTRYLARHFCGDIDELFRRDSEIDMGGARIGYDCMGEIIRAVSDGIHIYDSVDPKQDAYLKDMARRLKLQEQLDTKELYVPPKMEIIVDYIKSLREDRVYEARDSSDITIAYEIIVQSLRPDVTVNPSISLKKLFLFIRSYLFPCKKRWDEFYRLVGSTFIIEKPDADYENYIRENIVVPTAFGKEKVFASEEWQPVIRKATESFEENFKYRHHKIKDYL